MDSRPQGSSLKSSPADTFRGSSSDYRATGELVGMWLYYLGCVGQAGDEDTKVSLEKRLVNGCISWSGP